MITALYHDLEMILNIEISNKSTEILLLALVNIIIGRIVYQLLLHKLC